MSELVELGRNPPDHVSHRSVNLVSWSAEFGSRNYLFAALNQTSSGAYTGYGREERTSAFSTSLAGRQLEERVRTELMQKWKELDEKVCPFGQQILVLQYI